MGKDIKSKLQLENLAFDKIEFLREGNSSNAELEMNIQSNIAKKNDDEMYRVTLVVTGVKEKEYSFEIRLTGFFSFRTEMELTDEEKREIISKNTVAILMPYMRSEISLLTAQPGMECVVLPLVNTGKMFEQ